jgi:hypothetical protein
VHARAARVAVSRLDGQVVLGRLEKDLGRLARLAQPIYDHAVSLSRAEGRIAAAKDATDTLSRHLQAPKRVRSAAPCGAMGSRHALEGSGNGGSCLRGSGALDHHQWYGHGLA